MLEGSLVGFLSSGFSLASTSLFLKLGLVFSAISGLCGSIVFRNGLLRMGFQCLFITCLIQLILRVYCFHKKSGCKLTGELGSIRETR